MNTVRFGIIGGGLMGREFASAAARWCHLPEMDVRPEIVAVCDKNPALFGWYQDNFPAIRQVTEEYQELLANSDVEAVYCAVPHNMHEEIYCAIIEAGKHMMGEKPFGIDKPANDAILACIANHPDVFVRCCSQMPFYPAVQKIGELIESGAVGTVIRGPERFSALQRHEPRQAHQLEAHGRDQRRVRRYGRSWYARLPRSLPRRVAG